MAAQELYKTVLLQNTNLKAYYRFESGAETTDSSGNSNTLTAISDPAATTGIFGQGIALDGNDAYSITDTAVLKPTGAFTIGAWFSTTTAGAFQHVFQSYNEAGSKIAGIAMVINSSNQIGLIIGKNTGATAPTDFQAAYSTTTVTDGVMRFCVVTWDGATMRVYLNAKCETSVAYATAPVYQATNYVTVGCGNIGAGNARFITGNLDDVFLFNGTALSADQIKELYEGRMVGEGWPQAGLVGGWHLNGNSTDFSGNGNNGSDTTITYSQANGKLGQGAGFNGSTSGIHVGTSAALNLTSTITIALWAKYGATQGYSAYVSRWDTAGGINTRSYNFCNVYGENNKPSFILSSDGTDGGSHGATAPTAISNSVWYYLVGTYDGTNIKLYINGNLVATTAHTGIKSSPNNRTSFGCAAGRTGDSLGNFFNGAIDEVQIYNVAKDARWVRQQYALGLGRMATIL